MEGGTEEEGGGEEGGGGEEEKREAHLELPLWGVSLAHLNIFCLEVGGKGFIHLLYMNM